jgi:AAA domain/Domain of unknown function (DUF3854)
MLTDAHLHLLAAQSAHHPDVIAERASYSLSGYSGKATLKRLGFADYQQLVPGLLLPLWDVHRQRHDVVLRPDKPRTSDGKKIKYDQAHETPVRIDCHPRCQPQLLNPDVPLWCTEGQRKEDALVTLGLCAVDFAGVWGFRVPKKLDPKQPPLPDWKYINVVEREVIIAYDSDVTHNPDVGNARALLARLLTGRGAKVRYCTLPALATGEKQGVDDFLAAGGTLADLEALITDPPTATRARAVRITARELKAKELPELTYVVEDILPAGCTVFTGKSKDGKSLAAYNLAVAVASGGVAFGRYAVTQGKVWYLALEDSERRAKHRLTRQEEQMGGLPEALGDNLAFTLWEAPRLGEGLEDDLREWITTEPEARLIIIDILEKVRPVRKLNGNLYTEDYEATASLTRLAQEYNIAILVVHHANKLNSADFRDTVSGAMSLLGGADNLWSLKRTPMNVDAVLHITGRDIEQEQELAMQFKDGYWTAVGNADDLRRSQASQDILAALAQARTPQTPKDLADALTLSTNTVRVRLTRMLQRGDVMKSGMGYTLGPPPEREERESERECNPCNWCNACNGCNACNVGPNEPDITGVQGGVMPDNSLSASNDESYGDEHYRHYTITGITGITPPDLLQGEERPPPPLADHDCYPQTDAPPPCFHCHGVIFWRNAAGEPVCARCHPQPKERS